MTFTPGQPARTRGVWEEHVVRVRYVNRDHAHPLYGLEGVVLVRSTGGGRAPIPGAPELSGRTARNGGPRAELVKLDDGRLVIAPYGNWRGVKA